jgi:hypothetical protein
LGLIEQKKVLGPKNEKSFGYYTAFVAGVIGKAVYF